MKFSRDSWHGGLCGGCNGPVLSFIGLVDKVDDRYDDTGKDDDDKQHYPHPLLAASFCHHPAGKDTPIDLTLRKCTSMSFALTALLHYDICLVG